MLLGAVKAARRFRRDASGATVIEFAIVALPFLAMVFAILETAIVFYFSESLDEATQLVAQQIRTGAIQLSSTSQQQMATTYICPKLPGAMICSNLQVGLQANATCGVVDTCWQSDYSNWTNGVRAAPSLTTSSYTTGAANNTLYLTVAFPMPLLSTLWSSVSAATINGQKVRAIVSTAIFVNDPAVQH